MAKDTWNLEGESFQQSAVSVQLLDERDQHAFHLYGSLGQTPRGPWHDRLQFSGQQQVLFEFAC